MPLLRLKPFKPEVPSPSLKEDDEVFLCSLTGEVFTDYEAFYQRMILCNSLVWSCSISNKVWFRDWIFLDISRIPDFWNILKTWIILFSYIFLPADPDFSIILDLAVKSLMVTTCPLECFLCSDLWCVRDILTFCRFRWLRLRWLRLRLSGGAAWPIGLELILLNWTLSGLNRDPLFA